MYMIKGVGNGGKGLLKHSQILVMLINIHISKSYWPKHAFYYQKTQKVGMINIFTGASHTFQA